MEIVVGFLHQLSYQPSDEIIEIVPLLDDLWTEVMIAETKFASYVSVHRTETAKKEK